MAKTSTTHVIEIDTGIGEPAFVPLTLGQELQPISVGKKGMWRLESPRVLDVHAFFYFDGKALYLQSADETSPASVDGYPVGKAWTELHAPCRIEVGAARLRFRSLIARAEEDDAAATAAMQRAPVAAPARSGPPPVPARSVPPPVPTRSGTPPVPMRSGPPPPPPRPAAGAPPPSDDPPTVMKPERPFKPGEFAAAAPNDESTRFAPLEATGSRPNLGAEGPSRPAAGRGIEQDQPMRMESAAPRPQHAPGPPGPMQGPPPIQPLPHAPHPSGFQASPMGPMGAPMQPGMMMPTATGPHPPYPVGPGPGGPGGPWAGTMPGLQTGAYPGMDGAPATPGGPLDEYVAKYKELSPPKRILVFLAPFCLIASAYLILVDEEAPPEVVASADAGYEASAAVTMGSATVTPPSIGATSPIAPAQPVCPPGFVCLPASTQDAGAVAQPVETASAPPVTSAPPPASSGKTLERQAVDALAVNDYARAAEIYEELDRITPNRTYSEAARILRAKLDAGAF